MEKQDHVYKPNYTSIKRMVIINMVLIVSPSKNQLLGGSI